MVHLANPKNWDKGIVVVTVDLINTRLNLQLREMYIHDFSFFFFKNTSNLVLTPNYTYCSLH